MLHGRMMFNCSHGAGLARRASAEVMKKSARQSARHSKAGEHQSFRVMREGGQSGGTVVNSTGLVSRQTGSI